MAAEKLMSAAGRAEFSIGSTPGELFDRGELDFDGYLEALVSQAVRANIFASVDHLRHGSQVLEQLIEEDGLLVVGAEYSLETGVVEFFP